MDALREFFFLKYFVLEKKHLCFSENLQIFIIQDETYYKL